MKRMSEVFEMPLESHGELLKEASGVNCAMFLSVHECFMVARAASNADALADALDSIINASQLYMEDWSILDDAKAALAAYRGEA